MTTTYPQEAWCPSCRVTHPPGTRRCLHCGGPVSPQRPAEGSAAPEPVARTDEDEQATELSGAARPMKIAMAGLWIVLAIVMTILRSCAERG